MCLDIITFYLNEIVLNRNREKQVPGSDFCIPVTCFNRILFLLSPVLGDVTPLHLSNKALLPAINCPVFIMDSVQLCFIVN